MKLLKLTSIFQKPTHNLALTLKLGISYFHNTHSNSVAQIDYKLSKIRSCRLSQKTQVQQRKRGKIIIIEKKNLNSKVLIMVYICSNPFFTHSVDQKDTHTHANTHTQKPASYLN